MRHKDKMQLSRVGARVRVADVDQAGAQKWQDAKTGTITGFLPDGDLGINILMDGAEQPVFVAWSDLDLLDERPRDHLLEIPIAEVVPSRWQYRKTFDSGALLELAQSIQRHGLINPILIFKHESGGFELIAGERRIRAAWALAWAANDPDLDLKTAIGKVAASVWWDDWLDYDPGLGAEATIRAELRPGGPDMYREIAIVENLQREDPSPIEEASAYGALIDQEGWTQAALARHLGKSEGYVSQRLGLLGLAEEVKATVHDGTIPFASARAIATVPEPIQATLAQVVEKSLTSDEQANTRQVQALAGQIRRFFDAERWQPAEGALIRAGTKNRLRLLRYHIGYLMKNDPDRAGDAAGQLQYLAGVKYLGKKPATLANENYQTVKVLNVLTGADHNAYDGPDPYWQAYAMLKGHDCDGCQLSAAPVPETIEDMRCHCARWCGDPAVKTCLNWIGPEDPTVINLQWEHREILADHGGDLTIAPKPWGESADLYLDDVDQYSTLITLAAKILADQRAAEDRRKTLGHLENMRAYWALQPAGLSPDALFTLTHDQCHACKRCGHYRPELEQDPEVGVPCRFAAEPLPGQWGKGVRGPAYAVIVRHDGVMALRCERFVVAEIPTLAPVKGISFPKDKAGRALVLEWLKGVSRVGLGWSDRAGALDAPLSWLPYERPTDDWRNRDKMIGYIRENWTELGDRGIARLISVAQSEARAAGNHDGAMILMAPTTGDVERWGVVRWNEFIARKQPDYQYPEGWPTPWLDSGLSETDDPGGGDG